MNCPVGTFNDAVDKSVEATDCLACPVDKACGKRGIK